MKKILLAGAVLCLAQTAAFGQTDAAHGRAWDRHEGGASRLHSGGKLGVRKTIRHISRNVRRSYRVARRAATSTVRVAVQTAGAIARIPAQILPHPAGCPRRLFCGCGAAVEVFGTPRRDLWHTSAWMRMPRAEPAPGMAAVRPGHVFVIRQVLGNGLVLAYDANSGRGLTRLHVRSIAGWRIVNPRG